MAKAKVYEQYEKHYDEEAKVHYYVNARTGASQVMIDYGAALPYILRAPRATGHALATTHLSRLTSHALRTSSGSDPRCSQRKTLKPCRTPCRTPLK